jgi:hypothetical protein
MLSKRSDDLLWYPVDIPETDGVSEQSSRRVGSPCPPLTPPDMRVRIRRFAIHSG